MSTGQNFFCQNCSNSDNITTTTSVDYDLTSTLTPVPGLGVKDTVLEAIPFVENGLDGGWFGKIGTSASLIFGTFGNVMTIVILKRLQSGWSAMNVYLTFLALSDTTMLYTGTLPVWTRKMFRFDLYASHVLVCKVGIWVMNSTAAVSAWLLVGLTVQRAASVVSPHRVNLICTRKKSIMVSIIITIVCFLLYCHTLYGYDLVRMGPDTSQIRCTFGHAPYQHFWVTVWVRLDMFIYSLLPCVFLICSNAVLAWKLTVSVKAVRRDLSAARADSTNDNNRKKKVSSTTITIIIVSSAFVVLTIPLMAYNSFFQDYAAEDEESRAFHYFLYEFFFVVGLSNFAWNFYLYCLTGSRFRGEFVKIMKECCCCRCLRCSVVSTGSRYVGDVTHMTHMQNKKVSETQDEF